MAEGAYRTPLQEDEAECKLEAHKANPGGQSMQSQVVKQTLSLAVLGFLFFGCARTPFDPTPVVPTSSPLPYSARVKVSEIGTFEVEPGSSMATDPQLQSHVSRAAPTLLSTSNPADWERATVKYLATRKTFKKVVEEGSADLDLTLRINMFIDPSVGSGFNQVYLAITDATLSDPQTGRSFIRYSGFGRIPGDKKDKSAMERAVHAALRDLFGKMETDKRMQSL